ncbi:Hypothetical_protein [Hexamita inflata]|uniref:Hypothetical_protein n=1 Tax=Hexamita inflata TaxID=28002 RepID=A0AA86Q4S3_9EUKA|nr:Hypothetical protein HINF_LOCUS33697 [Hexamita inflata]
MQQRFLQRVPSHINHFRLTNRPLISLTQQEAAQLQAQIILHQISELQSSHVKNLALDVQSRVVYLTKGLKRQVETELLEFEQDLKQQYKEKHEAFINALNTEYEIKYKELDPEFIRNLHLQELIQSDLEEISNRAVDKDNRTIQVQIGEYLRSKNVKTVESKHFDRTALMFNAQQMLDEQTLLQNPCIQDFKTLVKDVAEISYQNLKYLYAATIRMCSLERDKMLLKAQIQEEQLEALTLKKELSTVFHQSEDTKNPRSKNLRLMSNLEKQYAHEITHVKTFKEFNKMKEIYGKMYQRIDQ